MAATVAILIVPVTLQIVSRYTALIPSWIWTEELSRFLFIWMIMLGAMVGVREGSHFVVDVLPDPPPRANALLQIVGALPQRSVRPSRSVVGHCAGALAQVNALLSVFFAGISGSSTADAASQGKIFIEAQVKEGYDLSFSIAITAVSAVLAVIIPPSILMIVWGGVLQVSIG